MCKFSFILAILLCSTIASAYSLQYHPFLLQTKDNKGITLAKTLDGIYGEKISVKNGRCRFYEVQSRGNDIEYELDCCRIDYNQEKIYTQADRLNGIEIKGMIWIEGNSYRTRPIDGKWSDWKSTELFSGLSWVNRTGTRFSKRNGEFIFEPTSGLKKIRGDFKYMSKHRAKAIENGDASGIIIRESGSGEIVIQESR